MLEEKILEILHRNNIEFLKTKRFENEFQFCVFFKLIMNSSHIFIKISYKILIIFLTLFFIITKISFISKDLEFNLFKRLINFLNKIILFREILKLIKTYSIIYNYD